MDYEQLPSDVASRFWAPSPARQSPSPCSFPTWGPRGLKTKKETTLVVGYGDTDILMNGTHPFFSTADFQVE